MRELDGRSAERFQTSAFARHLWPLSGCPSLENPALVCSMQGTSSRHILRNPAAEAGRSIRAAAEQDESVRVPVMVQIPIGLGCGDVVQYRRLLISYTIATNISIKLL